MVCIYVCDFYLMCKLVLHGSYLYYYIFFQTTCTYNQNCVYICLGQLCDKRNINLPFQGADSSQDLSAHLICDGQYWTLDRLCSLHSLTKWTLTSVCALWSQQDALQWTRIQAADSEPSSRLWREQPHHPVLECLPQNVCDQLKRDWTILTRSLVNKLIIYSRKFVMHLTLQIVKMTFINHLLMCCHSSIGILFCWWIFKIVVILI